MEQFLDPQQQGFWLLVQEGQLWLPGGELPHGEASSWGFAGQLAQAVGQWQGQTLYLLMTEDIPAKPASERGSLRSLLAQPEALFQLVGRAVQLAHFQRSHRFCGFCAAPLQKVPTQWAMQCSACAQTVYPVIAPCVIVAVRRGHQILLAQQPRHQGNMHTVLAGFVEPGETLEQAVAREVREETGIEIEHIRYIKSQPWPFPNSLMAAFVAEYAGGELCVDHQELVSADWFSPEALPPLPPVGTVARHLINLTLPLCQQAQVTAAADNQ